MRIRAALLLVAAAGVAVRAQQGVTFDRILHADR